MKGDKKQDKFLFRRWNFRKRKRDLVLQHASQDLGPGYKSDSSSCINYGSASFETDTATSRKDRSLRFSSLTDYGNSILTTDFDSATAAASDSDFFLESSRLRMQNYSEINPLEMYLHSRHERAMVRLCALLWLMKLQEDRSQRRLEDGGARDEDGARGNEQRLHQSKSSDKTMARNPGRMRSRSSQVVTIFCCSVHFVLPVDEQKRLLICHLLLTFAILRHASK